MMKRTAFRAVLAAAICAATAVHGAPVKVGNPGFMYSVPGAFLTVGRCEKGKYMFNTHPGLWIRNVSTSWRENFYRLMPSVDGRDVAVTECVMREGWLEAKTEKGAIEFSFLRPDVVLVRSKSPEMHIRFEYQFPRQKYDFPSTFGRTIDYMHFNADRILMDTRTGVRDPDRGNTVHVHPSKDGIEVALLDIHTGDWDGCDSGWDNSTAICMNRPPLETPDLQAFLILQMECLADIAKTLGRNDEARRDPAYTWMASAFLVLAHELETSARKRTLHNGF